MKATGIGEVLLTVWNGKGETTQIRLHDVLYVPSLGPNNISKNNTLRSVRSVHLTHLTLERKLRTRTQPLPPHQASDAT